MRLSGLAIVLLVPTLGACVVSGGHDGNNTNNNTINTQPLTVVVDTGQTMNAQGGQGVGIFVEYRAGGHWHVWWACDTTLSNRPCDFAVTMTGTSLQNSTTAQFGPNDTLDTSTPNQLVATTHTTTETDAVDFDATAGTVIQVDVSVSGIRDGQFFFFVQDGQINGNYQGPLTDPLIFEPSSP